MTRPDYTAKLIAQAKEVGRLQTGADIARKHGTFDVKRREQLAREWAKLRKMLAEAPKEFKQLNLLCCKAALVLLIFF